MPKKVVLTKKINPKTGLPLLDEESKLPFQPHFGVIYWLIAKPAYFLSHLIFPQKVRGRAHLPMTGGAVIAFNHISNLDSVTVSATARRRLHFLAKIELSRGLSGLILNGIGTVPVDRARRNSEALTTAVEVLKRGGVVAIAPEGITNHSGKLAPFKFGAVAMASRAGVPIIPTAIVGKYRPFRPIAITYGEPMMIDPKNLQQANEKLWYTINNMREKMRKGR